MLTTGLYIVVADAAVAQMNLTLDKIDPTNVGDIVTTRVALRSAPAVPVGRYCHWRLTDGHRAAILRAYGQEGWRPLRGSEGTVHVPGDVIPAWGTQRFWLFDSSAWGSSGVLSALGLTADIAGMAE